jgi:hypothetical protein
MAAAPRTEALNGSRWAPPSCPQRLMGHLVRAVTHKRDWREDPIGRISAELCRARVMTPPKQQKPAMR